MVPLMHRRQGATTIFRTPAMQESFEEQAVANLRREIDTLRKGVIPSLFSPVVVVDR